MSGQVLEASRPVSQRRTPALLRALAVATLVLLAALLLFPARAQASDQVVRVGYPIAEGYETGGDGERKAGWGYEYLQELAYHTGWTYEYVYGDFSDLLAQLAAGQIDLLGNVSYTAERDAAGYLYSSNPQGAEKYYICGLADDEKLATANPQALSGAKIGVLAGSYQEGIAQTWIDDEGIDAQLVEYASSQGLVDALTSGEVDAVVNTDTASLSTSIPIFYIGSSDYYIVAAPGRADLLAQTNTAMAQITATNPHFNEEIRSGGSLSGTEALYLTSAEQAWVDAHGGAVALGYLSRNLPYSACDADGMMDGAITALCAELESTFGITVETRAYATTDDLLAAVASGEVDVAVPLSRDFWIAENRGLAQTEAIVTAGISLLTLNEQGNYLGTVGCSQMDPLSSEYLSLLFTNGEVRSFSDTRSAVAALRSGQITSLAVPSASLDTIKDAYGLEGATSIVLPQTVELAAVLAKGQPELLDILDKAIGNSCNNVAAATLSHYSYADTDGTPLSRFFEKNAVPLLFCFAAVLLAAVLCLVCALRRAQAAEKRARTAAAAKTNFLNRMSHDIRTPLNGIIGLLQVSDLHPGDVEALAQDRAQERVAANHLLELLNDVLEMGRLEDAAVVLEDKPFDIREVMQDVTVLTRLRADEAGVTLVADSGAQLEYPHVIGSATSLRRILLNLLSNAVKYNKPGGQVRCQLSVTRRDGDVLTYRITVADTGIGMSEEFLAHLFEPFSQEKSDARSTYQGSGMGMPIVRALVKKMGGTVSVESAVGEGTTFVVELPFAIDPDPEASCLAEAAAAEDATPSIEGMHILLAEDNELNRQIACELLEMNGADVECAENGQEAVDLFCRRPEGTYDVILMDIMMPVMGGYEATRAIRLANRRDAADVPIVALTANAFAEDVKAAHDAGMNDHVAKPINIDVVVRTLAKYRR